MNGPLHILFAPNTALPWWRTDERFEDTKDRKVWTDCCGCKQPSSETESRLKCFSELPVCGDFGGITYPTGKFAPNDPADWPGAYFDPLLETRCSQGFGCTVNPRKKCGRELRETWRFGW